MKIKRMLKILMIVTFVLLAAGGLSTANRTLVDANVTIAPFNTSIYNDTMENMFGGGNTSNVSIEGTAGSVFQPYVDSLGPMSFIIIFGSLGLVYYIKTESTFIPGIITITDGALFLWMMPYDWQAIGYGIIMIGFVATVWGLVVRRGS